MVCVLVALIYTLVADLLSGIDVWSTNIWIHDVMVTNKVRAAQHCN